MKEDEKQSREIERLKALLSYGVLDTPHEKDYDGLVELASIICNTPIALISLIDDKRQWYKAKIGIENSEVPIEEAICQYTIAQDNLLEIPDTLLDDRSRTKPAVTVENGIRYYAGLPLKEEGGCAIGTVCVVDTKPHQLNEVQKKALEIIAEQTMSLLSVRKKNTDLGNELEEVLQQKIKETQELLSQKEIEYNNLFEAITKSNGVMEFSSEGTILSINKNFQDMLGYHEEELVGKNHSILLDQEDRNNNLIFWESLRNKKSHSGRFKRLHKNGEIVWIQASYNPVLNTKNEIIKITKIAQNITLEENSRIALEKAKAMADALNVQKDYFIANVSHEIRTPINAILGFTDLLLEQENSPEKYGQLEAIKTAGDNLLYLINDILDLSKIEAGVFQVDKNSFHLKELIENVFAILHLKAVQKKLNFDFQIASGVPKYIVGDKNRLAQILINLLGNALKFTHKGSVHLAVDIQKHPNHQPMIVFEVTDTGIGIPEDKLFNIFERFSQAEATTSRKYGGTGLGLNICKLLVEKQGGTIHVTSTLGQGARFVFSLPLLEPLNNELVMEDSEKDNPPSLVQGSRILMCEDNELNQKLAKAIFQNTPHSLTLAENGLEGLKLLEKNEYDLVLMDIQMPELDGYQTTQVIRNDLKIKVPIIALTAHSMVIEREKCLALGMNDYLSKPFKKEELFAKIAYWLGHSDLAPPKQVANDFSKNLLSLVPLEEFSGGDKDFQKEMLQLFQIQSKATIAQMEIHLQKQEFLPISALAHKLKSSFGLIDADNQYLIALEKLSKTTPSPDEMHSLFKALASQISQLNFEINHILNHFSP